MGMAHWLIAWLTHRLSTPWHQSSWRQDTPALDRSSPGSQIPRGGRIGVAKPYLHAAHT